MAMSFEEILSHFSDVEMIRDNSARASCPCKQHHNSSLSIWRDDNGKVFFKCYGGCNEKDIRQKAGLTLDDLGRGRPDDAGWKKHLELSEGQKLVDSYDYTDAGGSYLYSKVRLAAKNGDKEIRYLKLSEDRKSYEWGKGGQESVLYHLPALVKAVKAGFEVCYCEGEKDTKNLEKLGFTATTAGGADDWRQRFARYFTGSSVTVFADNDEAGQKLAAEVCQDLKRYCFRIRVITPSKLPKGDITDYLEKEGGTKESLGDLLSQIPYEYAAWVTVKENKDGSQNIRVNPGILAATISKGVDYLITRQPDEEKDDFYLYESGVYRNANRNTVKSLICQYLPIPYQNSNTLNNVADLLYCQDDRIVSFSDLDREEDYINLKNGLLNINTGMLEPHSPKHLLTHQLDVEYQPRLQYNESRPVFAGFMDDLCRNEDGSVDGYKRMILQEYGGLVLSNVCGYRTKRALVLWSEIGNTGKSRFIDLLSMMLGEGQTINIPLQNMNEQSRFLLGGIVGKRLISVGDQSGSEVRDSSVFKQLTGGDQIKVEQKGKRPYNYLFSGCIIIACNNLPAFSDDKGAHIFDRMCLMPCDHFIPEQDRDSEILDRMAGEVSSIFNWFFMGLQRLRHNGYRFSHSLTMEDAMTEYRKKMDTVYRYCVECCELTGDRSDMIQRSEFNEGYKNYCHANGFGSVGKSEIKDRMAAIGCPVDKVHTGNLNGEWVYRGIKRKDDDLPANLSELDGGTSDDTGDQAAFPFT